MDKINWHYNSKAREHVAVEIPFLNETLVKKVRDFHQKFAQYVPTPLRNLDHLAKALGVGAVYVKDESYRFGLNAFKVLGGTYAIGRYLANQLDVDISELTLEMLQSEDIKKRLGTITFATTTDGNHGRGVAWAAREFGQKCVIYMPKGSAAIRLENIKALGAQASITDLNYDDTVRFTADQAKKNGWVIVQDTAWTGYQDIPTWIMQGYVTMGAEAIEQLQENGVKKPTHVFVQAGVGTYAGAIQGLFANYYKEDRPINVVVEPNHADCHYQSSVIGDGKPHAVHGDLRTIMAGLACGEPNPISWEILDRYAEMFITCPDYVAALGMRILGNPLGTDAKVISGESGAVTTGILSLIMQKHELQKLKENLHLDETSTILLINTEGDTDPVHYRSIVWDGNCPVPRSY